MQLNSPSAHSRSAPILRPVWPIFRAVAATVVPEAPGLDAPQWAKFEELVAEALGIRSLRQQRQLRLFLRVVQWLPICRYGRTFTSLDPARRKAFLAYLQDHRLELIRTGCWGLRTLALLGYYGRLEAAQTIGYMPDVRGWEARP